MEEKRKISDISKWIKNVGTLLIGIAGITISFIIGRAANELTKMQIELTNSNSKNQIEITERMNKHELELKTIEIFLELIKGETLREKEMAVRLLHILDKDMALELAVSVATNKSEDANIALAAFRIGKQIDTAHFLETILGIMNISLSDKNTATIRGYLNNPDSGYQHLAEILYIAMERSTLDGSSVPLDIINAYVMRMHGTTIPILGINSFNISYIKSAVLESWREKNSSRVSRVFAFEDIIY